LIVPFSEIRIMRPLAANYSSGVPMAGKLASTLRPAKGEERPAKVSENAPR
jgi:hypothetical protein